MCKDRAESKSFGYPSSGVQLPNAFLLTDGARCNGTNLALRYRRDNNDAAFMEGEQWQPKWTE